jgi:ankyrin repeat protein
LAGDNPLVRAAAVGSGELCQLLVDRGADPNFAVLCEPERIYREGETALHTAIHHLRVEPVVTLLRCGADPTQSDASGLSPLDLVQRRDLIRYRGLKPFPEEDLDQIRATLLGRGPSPGPGRRES